MGEVGSPLYKQPEQGHHIHTGYTILQGWTMGGWMKTWAHFLLLPGMVCDAP